MRNVVYGLALVFMAVFYVSCNDEVSDMPEMDQIKDSIFAAYPNTVASIEIAVEHKTNIKIILGGQELYKSFPAKGRRMANDIGMLVNRTFGKDSYLESGMLIVTRDERNKSLSPSDGISVAINIDSLKKF